MTKNLKSNCTYLCENHAIGPVSHKPCNNCYESSYSEKSNGSKDCHCQEDWYEPEKCKNGTCEFSHCDRCEKKSEVSAEHKETTRAYKPEEFRRFLEENKDKIVYLQVRLLDDPEDKNNRNTHIITFI